MADVDILLQNLDLLSVSPSTKKLIVGIDYGTTFLGISYVITDKKNIDGITILTSWPGRLHTAPKTPTRIAYQSENPGIQSNRWGYQVDSKLVSYSWTKLLLDKNAAIGEYDDPAVEDMFGQGMMQLPAFRDAAGLCEDYLHEVFRYTSSKLRQRMSDVTYDQTPMECWITLPAIWSEEAKDATLKAAKNAGFGNRPGDEIFTIAEPEAAAIATLKFYSQIDSVNVVKLGEHILICDCGGGTVDITTYTITQVQPHLEFDELCIGVGGKCGSTQIDRNLHTLLSKRFGDNFDRIPFIQKGPGSKFMDCFEQLKQDFGNDNDDDNDILELSPLKLGIPDSDEYDDEERIVKLTHKDMKSLFDPVISGITNLVSQQLKEAKRKGVLINRIILVGGFGDSLYLNKVLSEWCQRNGNITLMCPEDPQSAVVRGAALRALEGLAPKVKYARMHYGVQLSKYFREGIDPQENAHFSEFTGKKLCKGRMEWLISKGEKIFSDTFRTINIYRVYTPNIGIFWSATLYSTALNEPPEHYNDNSGIHEVGDIVSKFDKDFDFGPASKSTHSIIQGKTVHMLEMKLQIRFGDKGDNLTFRNLVNDEVFSTATIEFARH